MQQLIEAELSSVVVYNECIRSRDELVQQRTELVREQASTERAIKRLQRAVHADPDTIEALRVKLGNLTEEITVRCVRLKINTYGVYTQIESHW